MALLWCSTCRRYHMPQPSSACERPGEDASARSRPMTPVRLVANSAVVGVVVGFCAGQATNDARLALVVALGVSVVTGVIAWVGGRKR